MAADNSNRRQARRPLRWPYPSSGAMPVGAAARCGNRLRAATWPRTRGFANLPATAFQSNESVPMAIRVVRTVSALRRAVIRWRGRGERIALVPTMGGLHEGHLALVRAGRRRARRLIVSIFVNPAQFAPHEDLASYPRSLKADLEALTDMAVDLAWAPAVALIYPPGFATRV